VCGLLNENHSGVKRAFWDRLIKRTLRCDKEGEDSEGESSGAFQTGCVVGLDGGFIFSLEEAVLKLDGKNEQPNVFDGYRYGSGLPLLSCRIMKNKSIKYGVDQLGQDPFPAASLEYGYTRYGKLQNKSKERITPNCRDENLTWTRGRNRSEGCHLSAISSKSFSVGTHEMYGMRQTEGDGGRLTFKRHKKKGGGCRGCVPDNQKLAVRQNKNVHSEWKHISV